MQLFHFSTIQLFHYSVIQLLRIGEPLSIEYISNLRAISLENKYLFFPIENNIEIRFIANMGSSEQVSS